MKDLFTMFGGGAMFDFDLRRIDRVFRHSFSPPTSSLLRPKLVVEWDSGECEQGRIQVFRDGTAYVELGGPRNRLTGHIMDPEFLPSLLEHMQKVLHYKGICPRKQGNMSGRSAAKSRSGS